jgi:catechol 2,3-dioxygenase-like lactoylglutathione lyase family enzyme
MGGRVVADETVDGDPAARFYGVPAGTPVRQVTVSHGPARYGMVQLLDFGAAALGHTLDGVGVQDYGASRTLDFFVAEHAEAERRLREVGLDWFTPLRTYGDEAMRSTEGLMHGPDRIHMALLKIDGPPRSTFVQGTELFSEIGASSQIIRDLEPAVRFYTEGLGFVIHLDDELGGPEIDTLVGLPAGAGLHLTIVAPEGLNTGKVALVRYGGEGGRSFSAQARPPRIGILAHGFRVDDLDELLPRLERLGGRVEVPPGEVTIGPWGRVRAAAVGAPTGTRIELFEAPRG